MAGLPLPARDLVVVALPGVQRFIGQSGSTADVRAGSEIVARLALCAANACEAAGAELVFPSGLADEVGAPDGGREGRTSAEAHLDGMPNRVVVLARAGRGARVASAAKVVVEQAWDEWVRAALKLPARVPDRPPIPETPATPGFPGTQWLCVTAGPGGYADQWRQARQALDARRRVRDFGAVRWPERTLCALSPRWPSERIPDGLEGAREGHPERRELGEASLAADARSRWLPVD